MPKIIITIAIAILIAVGAYFSLRRPATAPPTNQPTTEAPRNVEPVSPNLDLYTEAGVRLNDYPEQVSVGSFVAVKWTVTVPTQSTTTHTALHYDTRSHAGALGTSVTPAAAGYANLLADYANGTFAIPAEFTGNITAPATAGTLYLRAHAIIEGKHYWTDEVSISVR